MHNKQSITTIEQFNQRYYFTGYCMELSDNSSYIDVLFDGMYLFQSRNIEEAIAYVLNGRYLRREACKYKAKPVITSWESKQPVKTIQNFLHKIQQGRKVTEVPHDVAMMWLTLLEIVEYDLWGTTAFLIDTNVDSIGWNLLDIKTFLYHDELDKWYIYTTPDDLDNLI